MPSLTTPSSITSLSGLAPSLFPRPNRATPAPATTAPGTVSAPSGSGATTAMGAGASGGKRPATSHRRAAPGTASARITVDDATRLTALSASDVDSLSVRLRLAWALTLRSYTGQDEVCFGVQSFDHGGEMRFARYAIDETLSVQETLQNTAPISEPVPIEQVEGICDTAVVTWGFGKTKTVTPCGPLAPVSFGLNSGLLLASPATHPPPRRRIQHPAKLRVTC
jgi:hypothetical protein